MNGPVSIEVLKQHLIDPEICIRCNTCEETCPIDAITHDDNNYVVRADVCNGCMACISPCPTGAIDNWRTVLRAEAYSIDEQLTWDVLPAQGTTAADALRAGQAGGNDAGAGAAAEPAGIEVDTVRGSTVPPWSAAKPYVNLYTHKAPLRATVVGNYRLTEASTESDIHHIVLDFGTTPFPVLEGQSLGILPPDGSPHLLRRLYGVFRANYRATVDYRPETLDRPLLVLRATEDLPAAFSGAHRALRAMFASPGNGWEHWAGPHAETMAVPGNHLSMMDTPHVEVVAARLGDALRREEAN